MKITALLWVLLGAAIAGVLYLQIAPGVLDTTHGHQQKAQQRLDAAIDDTTTSAR